MREKTAPYTKGADDEGARARPQWTVVIPFYNEEAFLGATLASLRQQTVGDMQIILVDNNSTDRSPQIAKAFERHNPALTVRLLHETTPGKAAAMKAGIAAADSDFTALADADTIYPPHYLEKAGRLLAASDENAAAFAIGLGRGTGVGHIAARAKGAVVGSVLARQCHTGGYGQTFRTDILHDSGGIDPALWPYCLMDHELAHRVAKRGRIAYGFDFWCVTSDRRDDRSSVRWTLGERLLYHATPHAKKDWFFYDFLAPRFERRGLSQLNLRTRAWEET